MLKRTKQKLENIAKLAGKNEKRDLLKNYLNNDEVFAEAVRLMLDENISFNINELPSSTEKVTEVNVVKVFQQLNKLAKAKGVTDKQKQELANMLDADARDVVLKILNKKTDAGFGLRSVTTMAPWLLFQTPYQRCSTIAKLDRIEYPAIVQRKADGMFAYASIALQGGLFPKAFLSRRGKGFDLFGQLESELQILSDRASEVMEDPVFVGELTILEEDNTVMPRQKGNGLLNKFIKGTGEDQVAKKVVYTIWDVLPGKDFASGLCETPYGVRFNILMNILNTKDTAEDRATKMKSFMETSIHQHCQLIESEMVDNQKAALQFYERMRKEGEEGAILKDEDSVWKSNTATDQVKLKHFAQAEFRILDALEGKGKYKGMLGALQVGSEDGKIVSNVGSGFTDAQRQDLQYWKDNIGSIITAQFESTTTDKKRKDVKSLFLPTFIDTRFNEKTEADTLEYVESLIK